SEGAGRRGAGLAPLEVGMVFGLLRTGDVDEDAAHADWDAMLVAIRLRARSQPSYLSVRKDDAEFVDDVLSGEGGRPHGFDGRLAIVRMDHLLDRVAVERRVRRQPEHRAAMHGRPYPARGPFEVPQADVCGGRGEPHPFLALPRGRLGAADLLAARPEQQHRDGEGDEENL